jgi:hypothetical protein
MNMEKSIGKNNAVNKEELVATNKTVANNREEAVNREKSIEEVESIVLAQSAIMETEELRVADDKKINQFIDKYIEDQCKRINSKSLDISTKMKIIDMSAAILDAMHTEAVGKKQSERQELLQKALELINGVEQKLFASTGEGENQNLKEAYLDFQKKASGEIYITGFVERLRVISKNISELNHLSQSQRRTVLSLSHNEINELMKEAKSPEVKRTLGISLDLLKHIEETIYTEK